jgi:membrane-associated protein
MQEIWHFIQELVHPKSIITYGGIWLLFFIIFAETGLFFGFFLPGDSLLFIAGLFSATGQFHQSIWVIIPGLILMAILGNFVGYFFGLKAGNYLLKAKDNLFYKRRYLETAHDFYEKRGSFAIVLGRFAPIIRTFVPIFAGMVKMDWKKFSLYNIIGAMIWVPLFVLIGYGLGNTYPKIGDHLELVVIFLIGLSLIPVLSAFLRKKPTAS